MGGPGGAGLGATCLGDRGRSAGHTIVPVGRPELELAGGSAEAIRAALAAATPDVIVSAAAYTAVDQAESEPDRAFAVNAAGAGKVAQAAAELDVPLVHLSTDYVFAGTSDAPYAEGDPTGPQGVYGASKLAGEQAVLAAQPNTAILRTAWVYSPFGANFVKTMLRLAETRPELGVVADQWGNPTSALDLADGVLAVAANLVERGDDALRGVFHMTAGGETHWAGLAEAIFAASTARGGPSARVIPITTAQFPTPARRPANSRLDCARLARVHDVRLPEWRGSLAVVIERLLG
ncbi:MAG: dTDP-4-dehydrorhamnose reductase [Sphingomonadales bacterium]|nr:dTDP-4-dehydrorhamnose reductase [Sphingomonadales bacterium]